jgi:hypothetical protein
MASDYLPLVSSTFSIGNLMATIEDSDHKSAGRKRTNNDLQNIT